MNPDQRRSSPLIIDEKQNKLLQNALRIKIMHILSQEDMTSKQVADRLRKTPGNVHYHIQRLYEGGLLELTDTRSVAGIVEKYYTAKASQFHFPGRAEGDDWQADDDAWTGGSPFSEYHATRLDLSDQEAIQFSEELKALFEKWEKNTDGGNEYGVTVRLGKIHENEGD
ncbi:winged helix-turn-helix domain-containing protein [Saccharibacillus sp. JS10]|uniref:winged helix-turn-helix domain-containing protein n=1 Tax=Saccharibacillus sp. JS10 TaxID=2950552 RepID=UPI00210D1DE7|nr:winged helix-turn-helix domain-containing protein [Saccharibacillus sp. JS10]MCQ4088237.1 winged helix-turn-helix domain-containing protein [Saccharibacillus sp. JS10]